MTYRAEDFKIGQFHGKLVPDRRCTEARIRNELCLIGMLRLEYSRTSSIDIRLISYEMPLQCNQPRGRCIDLFGYDASRKPWIIELKANDSMEKIEDVIEQINGYASDFENLRTAIQNEVQKRFLWNEFKFSDGIGKMILAGREFHEKAGLRGEGSIPRYDILGIHICSFSRVRNSTTGKDGSLLNHNKDGIVQLSLLNK